MIASPDEGLHEFGRVFKPARNATMIATVAPIIFFHLFLSFQFWPHLIFSLCTSQTIRSLQQGSRTQFLIQYEFSQPREKLQIAAKCYLSSHLNLLSQCLHRPRLAFKEGSTDGILWRPLTSITSILGPTLPRMFLAMVLLTSEVNLMRIRIFEDHVTWTTNEDWELMIWPRSLLVRPTMNPVSSTLPRTQIYCKCNSFCFDPKSWAYKLGFWAIPKAQFLF